MDSETLSCGDFRRLIFDRSDRKVKKLEPALNRHEKTCLACNLWLMEEFKGMEEVLLDTDDLRSRSKAIRRLGRRIDSLRKQVDLAVNLDQTPQPPESRAG